MTYSNDLLYKTVLHFRSLSAGLFLGPTIINTLYVLLIVSFYQEEPLGRTEKNLLLRRQNTIRQGNFDNLFM